jgi:hypothetical protein
MLKVDLDFPVAGKFDDISSVSIASEVVIDAVKIITVVTSFTPFLQEKFYLPADGDTVSQIKTYYANGRNNGLSEIVVNEGFTVELPNNWSGFYDDLLVSQTYSHLAALSVQVPNISLAVTAMAFALIKGEKDPDNPNRIAALQASVDGVLAALTAVGQSLSIEQLAEVRTMLDANNFQSITMDGG